MSYNDYLLIEDFYDDTFLSPRNLHLRRERDSNPRNAFGVYTLSRRASSTTRAPLLSTRFHLGQSPKCATKVAIYPHSAKYPSIRYPLRSSLPLSLYPLPTLKSLYLPCPNLWLFPTLLLVILPTRAFIPFPLKQEVRRMISFAHSILWLLFHVLGNLRRIPRVPIAPRSAVYKSSLGDILRARLCTRGYTVVYTQVHCCVHTCILSPPK